jgi:ABC-type Fe3+/spermidine/putrescine transport system ATPase subunit
VLPRATHDNKSAAVTLGLRPERIKLSASQGAETSLNALPGVIRERTYCGNYVSLSVEIADGTVMTAELPPGDATPPQGAPVHVTWKPEDAIVLSAV